MATQAHGAPRYACFELSYGKPAETIEIDTETLDPFMVEQMTRAERGVMMQRLLEQHPRLIELVPERLRAVEE
jgi:hypothetical protein